MIWTFALLLSCLSIAPQTGVTVRMQALDFQWSEVTVLSWSKSQLEVTNQESTETIPVDNVLRLVVESTDERDWLPDNGTVVIYPVAGGSLTARLIELDGGSIRVSFGDESDEVSIPLTSLSAALFSKRAELSADLLAEFDQRRIERKPGRDVLLMQRNKSAVAVPGTLKSLSRQGWTFDFGGKERAGALHSAIGVVLGSPVGKPIDEHARVRLVNGDEILGQIVNGNDESMDIAVASLATIRLPWQRIREVELSSNRVVRLTDLSPTESISHTVLGVSWPARNNQNAAGAPIRIGHRSYEFGLGTHATSRISFALNGDFARFSTDIGVDASSAPHGSVIFRVLGDDKVLFESEIHRGGDAPERIAVDLDGVNVLTLVCDPADELDLSDLANWANPVLIKSSKADRS